MERESLLVQDALRLIEYLSDFQTRYFERNGQLHSDPTTTPTQATDYHDSDDYFLAMIVSEFFPPTTIAEWYHVKAWNLNAFLCMYVNRENNPPQFFSFLWPLFWTKISLVNIKITQGIGCA